VCDDCGANADAFDHKPDALPDCARTRAVPDHRPKWVARSDDSETVVRERLKIYWRTRAMIEYYSARPTFRVIDGMQSPEQVREALVSAVASALGRPVRSCPRWRRTRELRLIVCRSAAEIEKLARVQRAGGARAEGTGGAVRPGITTADLDAIAEQRLRERAPSRPSRGITDTRRRFSRRVNEEVVHGIPSPRALVRGGHHLDRHGRQARRVYGDSAVTVPVGAVSAEAQRLLDVTKTALDGAVACGQGRRRVSDIGAACSRMSRRRGFSGSREFVGHGIGTSLHESRRFRTTGPRTAVRGWQKAWRSRSSPGERGKPAVKVLGDGWTAVHEDKALSRLRAHGGRHRGRVPGAELPDAVVEDRVSRSRNARPDEVEGWTNRKRAGYTADGIVMELLPSQLVRVELDGRHQVTAPWPVRSDAITPRAVGDRVRVALRVTTRAADGS